MLHVARRRFSSTAVSPTLAAAASAVAAQGLTLVRVPNAGHGLAAAVPYSAGSVLLTEDEPLAWAADPRSPASAGRWCACCFRALGEATPSACACPRCAASYCSPACRARAWSHDGHEVLCGGEEELREWCAARGHNHPRVAAAALASALARGDLVSRWDAMNRLAYASPPSEVPPLHVEGHACVVRAFTSAGALGGDAARFWQEVFSVRVYARLMATLRVNAFAIACPLGARASTVPAATVDRSSAGGDVGSDAGGGAGGDVSSDGDGCCSSEGSSSATCGTADASGSACDPAGALKPLAASAEGGTALYALASFANHDCAPSADVVVGPGGGLALRARRSIAPGEPVTITYLDSALPWHVRRKKLLSGYGFHCGCALCEAQAHESRAPLRQQQQT